MLEQIVESVFDNFSVEEISLYVDYIENGNVSNEAYVIEDFIINMSGLDSDVIEIASLITDRFKETKASNRNRNRTVSNKRRVTNTFGKNRYARQSARVRRPGRKRAAPIQHWFDTSYTAPEHGNMLSGGERKPEQFIEKYEYRTPWNRFELSMPRDGLDEAMLFRPSKYVGPSNYAYFPADENLIENAEAQIRDWGTDTDAYNDHMDEMFGEGRTEPVSLPAHNPRSLMQDDYYDYELTYGDGLRGLEDRRDKNIDHGHLDNRKTKPDIGKYSSKNRQASKEGHTMSRRRYRAASNPRGVSNRFEKSRSAGMHSRPEDMSRLRKYDVDLNYGDFLRSFDPEEAGGYDYNPLIAFLEDFQDSKPYLEFDENTWREAEMGVSDPYRHGDTFRAQIWGDPEELAEKGFEGILESDTGYELRRPENYYNKDQRRSHMRRNRQASLESAASDLFEEIINKYEPEDIYDYLWNGGVPSGDSWYEIDDLIYGGGDDYNDPLAESVIKMLADYTKNLNKEARHSKLAKVPTRAIVNELYNRKQTSDNGKTMNNYRTSSKTNRQSRRRTATNRKTKEEYAELAHKVWDIYNVEGGGFEEVNKLIEDNFEFDDRYPVGAQKWVEYGNILGGPRASTFEEHVDNHSHDYEAYKNGYHNIDEWEEDGIFGYGDENRGDPMREWFREYTNELDKHLENKKQSYRNEIAWPDARNNRASNRRRTMNNYRANRRLSYRELELAGRLDKQRKIAAIRSSIRGEQILDRLDKIASALENLTAKTAEVDPLKKVTQDPEKDFTEESEQVYEIVEPDLDEQPETADEGKAEELDGGHTLDTHSSNARKPIRMASHKRAGVSAEDYLF